MNRPHVKLLIVITAVLSGGSEGKQPTPSVQPLREGAGVPCNPPLENSVRLFADSASGGQI